MTKTFTIIAIAALLGLAACGNDRISTPRPTGTTCAAAQAELAAARTETPPDAVRVANAKRDIRTACVTNDPR